MIAEYTEVNVRKSYGTFLIVWSGQLASSLGNGMTAFALGVHVYRQTQSATSFAMVTLCLFLPSILLRPVGGVLADRFDRRVLIVLGDIGSAGGVLFLLFSVLTGSLDLWKIYLGVTINSTFTALQSPAYKASVTDLLTEDQYSRAGGMVQLASSAQHLLSPAAAGFLLSTGSITTILMLDISTFFFAVLAVLVIGRPLRPAVRSEQQLFLSEMKEGWITVVSNRFVLRIVMIISLVTFFLGFLQTLSAPMILSLTDARTLGVVQSISATGMLVSSLLLGMFSITRKHESWLILGLAGAGVCVVLLGLSQNIVFITGAFFLFFCALPLININADVLVRTSIPNEKQGRAWGIIGLLSQLGFVAAYSVSGFLADHIFNPLFTEGGALASTVGSVIGTGPGRGIAFMLILSGLCIVLTAGLTRGGLRR